MGCCAISSSSCEGENIIREILSKTKINNIGINDIDNQFVAKFSGIDDTSMPKSSIYTKALYSIVFVNDDSDAEIDENERKLTSSLFFFENANAPIEGNIRNSIFSYCLSIASEESESKFLSLFNFLEKTNQNNHDAICSFFRLFFYANFYEYYERIRMGVSSISHENISSFKEIEEKYYNINKVWKYYDYVFESFSIKEKYTLDDISKLCFNGDLLNWRTNRDMYIDYCNKNK